MIEQIVTSSVLIAAIWLLSFLWEREINPCIKYALWMLVAVKLLVPLPEFDSPISVMNVVNRIEEKSISYQLDKTGETNEANEDNKAADYELRENNTRGKASVYARKRNAEDAKERVRSRADAANICYDIWIAGLMLCVAAFLWSNLKFAENLRRRRMRTGRVWDRLDVYEVSGITGPCLFGLSRPAVYIPKGCMLSEEQKNYVLAHEYTHYRHKDHVWALIRCMCVAVHWYNPLVWLAAAASIKDGELACDAGTLRLIGKENYIKYGKTLIEIAKKTRYDSAGISVLRCSTGMSKGGRELKKRLQLIVKQPRTKRFALAILFLLCMGIVGCTFGNTASGNTIDRGTPSANTIGDSAAAERMEAGTNEKIMGEEDGEVSAGDRQEESWDFEDMAYRGVTLTRQPEEDKVCIEVQPSVLREYYSYFYIPSGKEQEQLKELAAGLLTEEEAFTGNFKGKKETGWRLVYKGRSFMVFEDDSLYCMYTDEAGEMKEYLAQNTELCDYVWNILGIKMGFESFDPAEIENIVSARLSARSISTNWQFYSQTITDKDTLTLFEDWFSNARYIFGGADCGNEDACLELTLADGRMMCLSVATDSCPNFSINGVYYDYRPISVWDNREFFGCFDEIPWDFK